MIVFVAVYTFLFFQLLALRCFQHLCRFPQRTFNEVLPYLRIDRRADLEDLLNPVLEDNLRCALGRRRFRKEQMRRLHHAQECIARRTHNSRIFQEWGHAEAERSRMIPNREAGDIADALVTACEEYRMAGVWAHGWLCIWQLRIALLPFSPLPQLSKLHKQMAVDLLDAYGAIETAAERLAFACCGEYHHGLVKDLDELRAPRPLQAF